MRKVRARLLRLVGLAVVLGTILVAAGCGGGGGAAAGKADLSGASLKVGSKEFTEQLVLGEITKQTLEAAGASATYNDLAGTVAARKALTSGQIDMYWEYTGTGWITHLGHTKPIPDRQKQFEAVAKEDLKKNNIKWLEPPAPANNTYAIAVRKEAYDELGVKQLSDFNRLIQKSPEKATICVGTEFSTRDDGLPGMEKAYGFQFPNDNVIKMDEGQIYQAVDRGERCNFGEVFQTDGRIEALDLELIEDNKNFFPIYNPALTMRQEVFKKYPEIEEVFEPISKKLTTETLQKLNAKVDVEGQLPEQVAEDWLKENNLI